MKNIKSLRERQFLNMQKVRLEKSMRIFYIQNSSERRKNNGRTDDNRNDGL